MRVRVDDVERDLVARPARGHDPREHVVDAETRAEVLSIGAERCDPSRPLRVIVVGDTPYDVRAALDIGALCLAVPTGMHDAASLRDAGAHRVVDTLDASLSDTLQDLLSMAP